MINIKTSIAFNRIMILIANITITKTTRIKIIMIHFHYVNKINPISIYIQNNIIGLHYITELINNITIIIIVTIININNNNSSNHILILIKYHNRE